MSTEQPIKQLKQDIKAAEQLLGLCKGFTPEEAKTTQRVIEAAKLLLEFANDGYVVLEEDQ